MKQISMNVTQAMEDVSKFVITNVPFFNCSCTVGFRLYNDKFCSGIIHLSKLSMVCTNTITDIDECSEGLSGCAHLCANTIGSYACTCEDGYQLSDDDHSCADIDECERANGGCEQICQNINGSYSCSCLPGYSLDSNSYNCSGIELGMSCHKIHYFT